MNLRGLMIIISTLTTVAFCDDFSANLINTYKHELEECKISLNQITTAAAERSSGSFRWEDMRINYVLPEDVVYAGQNAGLEPLFVVRGKGSNSNFYGKLPMPYSTRDAYLTNESIEFATKDFHILTAKAYSWCRPNSFPNSATVINPICRARYEGFLTPGTLVGSKCRVGWGWKTHFYGEFEVLIVGAGCA